MNNDDHDRLLRLIQGEATPQEAARLQQELAHSPALRREMEELRALHGLLRTTVHASAETALKPFFADRLLRRLAPAPQRLVRRSPEEELFAGLLRLFRPLALAGVLLILGFAAYNVTLSSDYGAEPSTTEAVLALPPVTLATAYDADF